jgi:hypothetical protein
MSLASFTFQLHCRLDFVKGFHGSHVRDYLQSSLPQFVVGEYWDSLSYGYDGTPNHNQDAHRKRIVNWIEAAGGLATAFGERVAAGVGAISGRQSSSSSKGPRRRRCTACWRVVCFSRRHLHLLNPILASLPPPPTPLGRHHKQRHHACRV